MKKIITPMWVLGLLLSAVAVAAPPDVASGTVPRSARPGYSPPRLVSVKLYDVAGKLCRTLVSQEQKSGLYQPTWDRTDNRGRSVPCGIYFCQMQTDSYLSQKKVVLVK